MQHVVEVQRTLPEKLTQSPVKTNIWNFILFCKLVFRYWRGSRAVHRCVNFKPHRHMGSPLLILETYVCSICTGNRLDVLGDQNRTCQLVRYRKIEQWSETKKSQRSHDLCSAASSWRLKPDFTATATTFNFSKHNDFFILQSQHRLTSDSWFEVVARHSQNGPAFSFHWLGCFASVAKRARYQPVKGYSHSSRCRWRMSGAHAHGG